MKKIIISLGIIFYIFSYCAAQKLEIKYYPTFYTKGICTFDLKGDSCILRLDILAGKNSSEIWFSETKVVPSIYIDNVNSLFEMAGQFTTTEPFCFDGMYLDVLFKSSLIKNEFQLNCPFQGIHYDFSKQSVDIMRKVLKERKSRRYLRIIKQYL